MQAGKTSSPPRKLWINRMAIVVTYLAFMFAPIKAVGADSVQMTQPIPESQIIGKKPLIQCVINEPFAQGSLFVYLDGIDVTGLLDVTADGFRFKPVQVLMSGQHQLTVILYANDGREIQQAFLFTNRHSENFEDMISANELTARYEGRIEKSDKRLLVPDNKIDANLGSSSLVRNGQWGLSFDTNIRYFDQDVPVAPPLEKGVFISNYLLALEKADDNTSHFRLELGDVQVNESTSTLINFARRGARGSLTHKAFTLGGFVVKSDPVLHLKSTDDTGLDGSDDDHLKGVSGTVVLVKDKALFKVIHLTGGSSGVGAGLYTEGGGNEGDLTGGVLQTDFFSQKFITELEYYNSKFDSDTTDLTSAEKDKAYRASFSGTKGKYNYNAAYEYFGLFYDIPGQPINNDRKGFSLAGGRTSSNNDTTFNFSRHRNNVENDSLLPDVYTTIGSLNYNWRKNPKFPVGMSYSKTILESKKEPPGVTPTELETDTASLSLMYLKENINLTLQPSYSVQNNRLSNEDSTNNSVTLNINYMRANLAVSTALSFNRTEFEATDEETDNYLANLQLQGRSFKDLLGYGLVGSYNLIETNSGNKNEIYTADGEIAYSLTGVSLFDLLNPTVGLRGTYNRAKDHLLNTSNEDWVIVLVLTSTLPFTL